MDQADQTGGEPNEESVISVLAQAGKSLNPLPTEVIPGRSTSIQYHVPQEEKALSDNGKTVVLFDQDTRQAKVVGADGKVLLENSGQFGQVDAIGNAYVGDYARGLFRYDVGTNKVEQIAPPRQVSVPFYVDATGHYLIHQTFYTPGSDKADHFTNSAVVLRDLTTGQSRILYEQPNQYVHALAWVGKRVLVQTWEDGPATYNVFKLVDLQGRSERLRALEQAPLAIGWPVASPNQQYLVYPSKEGVVVIHPASQKFQVYRDVDFAYWSRTALVLVSPDGTERIERPNFGG